jgi:hypothetical protein
MVKLLLVRLDLATKSNYSFVPHQLDIRPIQSQQDLVTTTEAENKVERGLLLNVVIGKRASIFQLLSGENQTLLIRRDAFLVLDLGLDVVDSVRRLYIEGDGLSRQSLDKDLHATAETEHQVEGGFLLNVVVRQSAAVLQLLSGKDQTLLVRRNALLVLDLGLDIVNRVRRFHVEGDGLSSEGFDENLKKDTQTKSLEFIKANMHPFILQKPIERVATLDPWQTSL